MGKWSCEWPAFVAFISDQMKQGATSDDISREIFAKNVVWTGVLTEKSLDDLAPVVTIDFPIENEELRNMGLGYHSVPVSRDTVDLWEQIPVGASVTFTAAFVDASAYFPPFEITSLDSGRRVATVRLCDGRPAK